MSKETAIQFFEAVDKSPELQRQIKPLDQNESPEGMKKFIDVASKAGYSFSVEDLKGAAKARSERHMQSGEQLSEKDLEQVAGGAWCIFTCFWTN